MDMAMALSEPNH